jgi:ribosomal protein S18 acetylase RimI-like enzyme
VVNIPGYALRRATAADAPVIRHHRRAMFHDMGLDDPDRLARMDAGFAIWLDERLADGHYIGWLACTAAGDVAAGAGLWLLDWPPTYHAPGRTRGYLLNVYAEPEHRRRGLARALVEHCMTECAERGITLVLLHASEAGRALYAGLGFQPSNEMRLFLDAGP